MDSVEVSNKLHAILAAIGQWPMSPGTKRYVRCLPWAMHIAFTVLCTLLLWLQLFDSSDEERVNNVLYLLLTEMGLLVKMFNIWWHKRLAMRLKHEWHTNSIYALKTGDERMMWRQKHKTFVVVFITFLTLCLCTAACPLLVELSQHTKQLPWSLWRPAALSHPKYYWCYFIYESIAMPWTCVTNTALDIYHCYILYYLSLIYRLIALRLQRIGSRSTDKENFEELVSIIQLHQRAKIDAKDCERLLSSPVLFQIFLSTLVLCLSIYRLQRIQVLESPGAFFYMVEYILVMTFQVFLPCYCANEITLFSKGLSEHLFSSNWVELSPRNRRLILIYMVHLKVPVTLRAGSFFDIGLPLFLKVINNAYSLLAVLLNMDN